MSIFLIITLSREIILSWSKKERAGRRENKIIGCCCFKHPSSSGKVWYPYFLRMQSTFKNAINTACLLWQWGVVVGMCRFSLGQGLRSLWCQVDMNSWWFAQGRECWGNTEKNSGTHLYNSKKRLMAKFYRLVEQIERVARKLAGSNYNWWKFWPKRSWDEKLRCLSELTLVVLGTLSTSTCIHAHHPRASPPCHPGQLAQVRLWGMG